MSYNISDIIKITNNIGAGGIQTADLSRAVLFAPESELPIGFAVDTYRVYSDIASVAVDFDSATDTYEAAAKWLGAIPRQNEIIIWGTSDADTAWADTLNKARNSTLGWWFWSFFTYDVYADTATDVPDIALWHNQNSTMFINTATGTAAAAVRDALSTADIASTLTTSGYRYAATLTHASDDYAGIAAAAWYASVNYSAINSTITGEFKSLSGVAGESLPATEYAAMEQDTKRSMFYTAAQLAGSTDSGILKNTRSHSSFNEWVDDVVNLEAFSNALQTALYNTLRGQPTKLAQTVAGQQALLTQTALICEQYIQNSYLGERNYISPETGQLTFTRGYEILTKPEDILSISDADRAARKAAAIVIRLFPAGAIHSVEITNNIYL